MKLEEILDLWDGDCKVDNTELAVESTKVAIAHHRYLKIRSFENLNLAKLKGELKKLSKLKYEYYNGFLDKETLDFHEWKPFQNKILKSDIPIYIDADDDVINLNLKISVAQEKVEVLDSIIRTINNRNYAIKNAIDWTKFTQGS